MFCLRLLIKKLLVIKHLKGSASDTNGLEKYLGVTVNPLPSDQSDNFCANSYSYGDNVGVGCSV